MTTPLGRVFLSTVIGLLSLRLSATVQAATVEAARGHELTGELVITDATADQFRLVRRGRSFTAPAGTSLRPLEGKPVRIQVDGDGHVLRISPMPMHFEPITHSYDLVSGELVIRDPETRTFAIAGDDATYTTPAGVDVAGYVGHVVVLYADEQGRVLGIMPMTRSGDAPAPSQRQCTLSDATIAHGLAICRHGATLRCADGEWVETGAACS